MHVQTRQPIIDPFWEHNLYEVEHHKLEQSGRLPPQGNLWNILPCSKNGSAETELTVYHAGGSYHTYSFRKDDIRTMKRCALYLMAAITDQACKLDEPAWSYNYWMDKESGGCVRALQEQDIATMSDADIEPLWNVYLKFCEYQYDCGRYRYRQGILWSDMVRDHKTAQRKFGFFTRITAGEEYLQLLLRVVASHLGHILRNVEGD